MELGLEERDGGLLLTRIALILFWYIALVDVLSGLAFKVLPPCLNLLHDIFAVLSCLWTLHDMQVRVFTKYHASSSFLWMNITWTRITNINRVGSMNLAIYIFLLYAFCFLQLVAFLPFTYGILCTQTSSTVDGIIAVILRVV